MSNLAATGGVQGTGSQLAADSAVQYGSFRSDDSLTIQDVVRLIQRHKLMILMIVGTVSLVVLFQQLLAPPKYQSTANVQVELINEVGTNQADVDSRNVQRVANAVRLHRSRSAVERVIKDLDLRHDPAFQSEVGTNNLKGPAGLQLATNRLLDMVDVSAEQGSDLMEIKVTSGDPMLSARIANQLPVSVGELRNSKSIQRRQKLLASLIQERDRRSDTAQETLKKVADFRVEHKMFDGAGGPEDLRRINDIAEQAAIAGAASSASAARSGAVVRASGMRSTAQASSPALDQLERQNAQLLAEQARISSALGPNHPDRLRVASELETVRQNIAAERASAIAAAASVAQADGARMAQIARGDAAGDAARAGALQAAAAGLISNAYSNAVNSVELSKLVRDANLAETAYNSISQRVEQIRAQMQSEGVSSSIVSPAVANLDPIAPSPVKNTLLAILASGFLAILLAFGLDLVDNKLRTSAQIRRNFGLRTFGMLPLVSGWTDGKSVDESPVITAPQSLFAEAARSAYSEVRSLSSSTGPHSVLVTSPQPSDGKSTVSLTLAAAAVALGKKTVLIDLDLRRQGVLHLIHKELETPDIVDVLSGRIGVEELLEIEGRDRELIAAGPATQNQDGSLGGDQDEASEHIVLLSAKQKVKDPAALLTGKNLIALIGSLREHFDFIVVNAPATLAVRDARAMCDYTDHTVVVVKWGDTTTDQLSATLEALANRASGIIFDQVDYADHARRAYGDSIQFYFAASAYYTDEVPPRITLRQQLRRLLAWRPRWTMAEATGNGAA